MSDPTRGPGETACWGWRDANSGEAGMWKQCGEPCSGWCCWKHGASDTAGSMRQLTQLLTWMTPSHPAPPAHLPTGVFEAMAAAKQQVAVLDWGIANVTLVSSCLCLPD